MDKSPFSLRDRPPIDRGNPTWETIELWAEQELRRLRAKREELDADQRKLDVALGSIIALNRLLVLPEAIRQERSRPEVDDVGFGIPPLTDY